MGICLKAFAFPVFLLLAILPAIGSQECILINNGIFRLSPEQSKDKVWVQAFLQRPPSALEGVPHRRVPARGQVVPRRRAQRRRTGALDGKDGETTGFSVCFVTQPPLRPSRAPFKPGFQKGFLTWAALQPCHRHTSQPLPNLPRAAPANAASRGFLSGTRRVLAREQGMMAAQRKAWQGYKSRAAPRAASALL